MLFWATKSHFKTARGRRNKQSDRLSRVKSKVIKLHLHTMSATWHALTHNDHLSCSETKNWQHQIYFATKRCRYYRHIHTNTIAAIRLRHKSAKWSQRLHAVHYRILHKGDWLQHIQFLQDRVVIFVCNLVMQNRPSMKCSSKYKAISRRLNGWYLAHFHSL